MNLPIAIVDESGKFTKIVISEDLLKELSVRLRTEGVTQVNTYSENGILQTYNAHAIVIMANGCNGSMMFIPED